MTDRLYVRAALLEPQPVEVIDGIRRDVVNHLHRKASLDPDALLTLYLRYQWYEKRVIQLEQEEQRQNQLKQLIQTEKAEKERQNQWIGKRSVGCRRS